MTPEELAAIKARAEAATAGPWEVAEYNWKTDDFRKVISTYGKLNNRDFFDGEFVCNTDYEGNASFIANARQDIPALLTELARLKAEKEYLQKLLKEMTLTDVLEAIDYLEYRGIKKPDSLGLDRIDK